MSSRLVLSFSILLSANAFSQPGSVSDSMPYVERSNGWFGAYKSPSVSPVIHNSQHIFELMRAGQIYLSLNDAIGLALENNLDIEVERYLPKIADTEVLRAKGGGLLRGLNLFVSEPPPGIGGPNGPLLTNLTAGSTPSPVVNTNFSDLALISQQQNNLSISQPTANGPAIPQFDPILSGSVNAGHSTTAELNPILTGSNWLNENAVNGNAGITLGLATGAQVSVDFNNSRYSTNSGRYTYNPFVTSSLNLTITQPILRGFGAGLNTRFIRIARNNRTVADLIFRQQVIDTVAGIARLYTDLVSLNEDLKVKREALRLAERLYEDNRNQVDQGTQAPIEVTRANAALAVSRQALITAEGLVHQQELILKTALTRGGLANPALLGAHIVPTDSLDLPPHDLELLQEDIVKTAIHRRADLASAGVQVDNSELALKGSLNAIRPQLDLVGTVQNSGLAGSLNPLTSISSQSLAVGGYGTALGQIFRRDYPTYAIGVQLSLPLRNRVAQADAIRDELELRQAQARRQQLEDQVRLEVANAQESLRQTRAAYEAAVEAKRLQEQSANVERQTFDVGLSTNFQVIQYQTYLAQANSTEVAAKAAYIKAGIALERALGTILEQHHLTIEDAYTNSTEKRTK